MTPENKAEELALGLMIGIQVLKYQPPKDFMRRQDYDKQFARNLVEKLTASGWEFTKVPKNMWTGEPVS